MSFKEELKSVPNMVIQAIGYVGMACNIASFQIKKNKFLFLVQTIGASLFLIHYVLLGQFTGAVMNLMGVARGAVFVQGKKLRKPWILAILLVLTTVATIFTWNGPISLLPFFGIFTSTIAMYLNDGKIIRLVQLCVSSPCWLIYNIIVGSQSGALCEIFIITSTVISLIRFGMKGFDKAD